MQLTRIDIYNLTLGNLKIGQRVASLNDETTREFMLPQNYDLAMASLLAMHDWSFATVSRKLARVTVLKDEHTQPGHPGNLAEDMIATQWRHSWVYPPDAARILQVGKVLFYAEVEPTLSYPERYEGKDRSEQDDFFDFRCDLPWEIVDGPGGRVLRTEHDQACARYLSNAVPEAKWPPLFVNAFTWALASNLTRAINASDADADYRMRQAQYYLELARRADAEEMGRPRPRNGNWIESRFDRFRR